MNYDLVKRLKDAGFPQDNSNIDRHIIGIYKGQEDVFYPTLSELIEECGEGFGYLTKHDDNPKLWQAFDDDGHKGQIGSTPEEAVANLYIALNTK